MREDKIVPLRGLEGMTIDAWLALLAQDLRKDPPRAAILVTLGTKIGEYTVSRFSANCEDLAILSLVVQRWALSQLEGEE